jgi:hypothetical protein
LSMPALCSRAPSSRPAGPAPMMATWVRIDFSLNETLEGILWADG